MSLKNLTNKNIKKIVCVYQLQYVNAKSEGFGDFLRGCFFTMQLTKLLNLEFELDISNHPISKYIENLGKNPAINYDNLEWVIGENRPAHLWQDPKMHININFANEIIDKLNNYSYSDTYALFTNAFPIYYTFLDIGREKVKNMLIPNVFMQEYINNTLKELNLSRNTYATIHIRSGDQYLTNTKTIDQDFINKIKFCINGLIVPNKKYLIISDSNSLKIALKSYPNFYIINRKIQHFGGQFLNTERENGVMDTLLDFYLMSYSNSILALHVYNHVTGFSKYCAVINKIPFKSVRILHNCIDLQWKP